MELTIEYINTRIENEYDKFLENQLSDDMLFDEYIQSKSVKNKVKECIKCIQHVGIEQDKQDKLIRQMIPLIISPGLKGVIRGRMLNNLIQHYIKQLNLNEERFLIDFEKQHEKYKTNEIPDWYIYDKYTDKILIGMNQIDLWSGGHQTNRASHYLFHESSNKEYVKIVCVISKFVKVKTKNRVFKIFHQGFQNNTLCYIGGLVSLISTYFQMTTMN